MNIRKMTRDDIDSVSIIGDAAPELSVVGDNSLFWSKNRLTTWIDAGQDVMLVAEENGEILGLLITQIHQPSSIGYISDLVVKESARGMGIGLALAKTGIKQMKAMGITYIYALTQEDNDKIKNLLTKEGFTKGKKMVWFEKRP